MTRQDIKQLLLSASTSGSCSCSAKVAGPGRSWHELHLGQLLKAFGNVWLQTATKFSQNLKQNRFQDL